MVKRIQSEPYSDELFGDALSLLDGLTGEVDTRNLCEGLACWGVRLVKPARERIHAKKAIERYKALELFLASGEDVADEVEAAREVERSKKLLRSYDFVIRKIRAKVAENKRVKVDPKDSSVDPLARLVELRNMPTEAFRALLGTDRDLFYGRDFELESLGFDRNRRRPLNEGWVLSFDGQELSVQSPDGKLRASLPKDMEAERTMLQDLKKSLETANTHRNQTLQDAFVTGDSWPSWFFRLLYLHHPLATTNSRGLVYEFRAKKTWTPFMSTAEGLWLDSRLDKVEPETEKAPLQGVGYYREGREVPESRVSARARVEAMNMVEFLGS